MHCEQQHSYAAFFNSDCLCALNTTQQLIVSGRKRTNSKRSHWAECVHIHTLKHSDHHCVWHLEWNEKAKQVSKLAMIKPKLSVCVCVCRCSEQECGGLQGAVVMQNTKASSNKCNHIKGIIKTKRFTKTLDPQLKYGCYATRCYTTGKILFCPSQHAGILKKKKITIHGTKWSNTTSKRWIKWSDVYDGALPGMREL